ncbi:MAG: FHA domain-containing protein, partial [Vicinamibacterales bacterium]
MAGTELPPSAGRVVVRLPDGGASRFSTPFHIGRDPSCEVQVTGVQVSRRHAEVSWERGDWIIRDLQSSNGLFVDGERVETASIRSAIAVTLGAGGPTVQIAPEQMIPAAAPPPAPTPGAPDASLDDYAQRYFGADNDDESVGGRTMMIRKAYQQVQHRQKRQQRAIIAVVALLGVAAGAYALYQHRLIVAQEQIAEELFYGMKVLDIRIAQLEEQAAATGKTASPVQASAVTERRQQQKRYDEFVARLYDRKLNEEDRLILRVTRIFGECEVAAPPEYLREVHHYIKKWQSTERFARAVRLAQQRGYTQRIASTFIARNLPPQYFYLAMQESSFDTFISGPPTRWGIAKGMWQFIPETGARYGLHIGPRASVTGTDVGDDRLNWEKATDAAARYVKDIYATDAQASGLLVIASYNWGEHRIIDLLRTMPADPRERNFWKLLTKYRERMPGQTYDYVFNIVSAAVIGENPRLFGFDFDSPLKG